MASYNGASSFILAGEETTFKTAVTPDKSLGVTASVDVQESNNLEEVRTIGDREIVAMIEGNYDASISLEGTMNSGALLEMFFGQSTDTETTGDYTHTFVDRGTLEVANNINSYTVSTNHDGSSDFVFTYAGVKCNTLEITCNVGESIKFSSELVAATVATSTSLGTKVQTTTTPLAFSQATLSTGDEGSESTVAQMQGFNLSLNNNIDVSDVREFGSRTAADFVVKQLSTGGEFTVKFANKTEAERFLGGTSPQSGITDTGIIFSANNGVTLGSGRVEIYVKLLGCKYESLGRTYGQDGVVEETFSFTGGQIDDFYFVDAIDTYF